MKHIWEVYIYDAFNEKNSWYFSSEKKAKKFTDSFLAQAGIPLEVHIQKVKVN